jgi:hypothetical protein
MADPHGIGRNATVRRPIYIAERRSRNSGRRVVMIALVGP